MPELMSGMIEERVIIPGAVRLEGCLTYPSEETRRACVIAPPHPYMGGTLDNRVLRRIAVSLSEAGTVCLRFNYRGVGKSDGAPADVMAGMQQFWETGAAPHDPMLVADYRAAQEWLAEVSRLPMIGAGYSFGAYCVTAAGLDVLAALILILPTLRHHDFVAMSTAKIPKLVVYTDDDFATPAPLVEAWFDGLPPPRHRICVPGGQHFFRGQEDRVADACRSFVMSHLEGGDA